MSKIIETRFPERSNVVPDITHLRPGFPHSESGILAGVKLWNFVLDGHQPGLLFPSMQNGDGFTTIQRRQDCLHAVSEIGDAGFHKVLARDDGAVAMLAGESVQRLVERCQRGIAMFRIREQVAVANPFRGRHTG